MIFFKDKLLDLGCVSAVFTWLQHQLAMTTHCSLSTFLFLTEHFAVFLFLLSYADKCLLLQLDQSPVRASCLTLENVHLLP